MVTLSTQLRGATESPVHSVLRISYKVTCRCLTTSVCQYIAVDQRMAIRKLFSSNYNTYKLAIQHGCYCWSRI